MLEDSYDFVFDESVKIQFALDAEDRIEGTLSGKDAALQAQIDEAERRGESSLLSSSLVLIKFVHSAINRRGQEVATSLRMERSLPRRRQGVSSPHYRRRNWIRKDDATSSIPPRSRLDEGRTQDWMYATSSSSRHVSRRSSSGGSRLSIGKRGWIFYSVRGLYERQDEDQVYDRWNAAAGVLDRAGSWGI